MLHGQSKGNGIHKSRVNGEDAHKSMAMLAPLGLVSEIHRVMAAVRAGQLHERARSAGFEGEEHALLEDLNQGLEALTTPLTAATEFLGCLAQGKIPDRITASFPATLT